jgi:hypothetical protein
MAAQLNSGYARRSYSLQPSVGHFFPFEWRVWTLVKVAARSGLWGLLLAEPGLAAIEYLTELAQEFH